MTDIVEGRPGWLGAVKPYVEKGPLAALFLGISSGFPFAMIGATLTTRLTEQGITRSAITAFALTFLAYNLKWAWAPIVDKFSIPVLGKIGSRRSWLIVTGVAVMVAVNFLGSIDSATQLPMLVIAAIGVGLAGATFDIVIDAYRIELLEPSQLGVGSGMSQYGWRIGSAAAGATALLVSDASNWALAYSVCALFALPAVVAGLVAGEPVRKVSREWPLYMRRKPYAIFILLFAPLYAGGTWIDRMLDVNILSNMVLVGYLFPIFDLSARRARDAGYSSHLTWLMLLPVAGVVAALWLGWASVFALSLLTLGLIFAATLVFLPSQQKADAGERRVDPFVEFFSRSGAFLVLLFVLLHKLGDTLANLSLRILFADLGFSKPEIAFYDVVVGFVALLIGIFVGGILYARMGMKRSVMISLILMAVSNVSFAALAASGHSNAGMAGAMAFENFASGVGGVAVVAYLSALCDLSFTATQFAMLSAAASILGRFLSGTTAGKVIDALGFVNFYLLTTLLALPGILLFWLMMRAGLIDASVGTAATEGADQPA